MPTQIELFDSRFRLLHERSVAAVQAMPSDLLFKKPGTMGDSSFGEFLLRSAAAVERTFGGITARLWDDPFEWTLPEELSTNAKIVEYLDEVEATRQRGFLFFKSDADLAKQLPAPEQLRSIFDLLLETLARAEHFQGRAFAVFQLVAGVSPPRF
jgi:hypothetical protein